MSEVEFEGIVGKVLFRTTKDGQETQILLTGVNLGVASRDKASSPAGRRLHTEGRSRQEARPAGEHGRGDGGRAGTGGWRDDVLARASREGPTVMAGERLPERELVCEPMTQVTVSYKRLETTGQYCNVEVSAAVVMAIDPETDTVAVVRKARLALKAEIDQAVADAKEQARREKEAEREALRQRWEAAEALRRDAVLGADQDAEDGDDIEE